MAQKIWIISYNIRKISGESYSVPQEMIREHEENINVAIRKAAKKIAEDFDFPLVEVTAKATEDGTTYNYKHQADEGFRDEWTVNPTKR